MSLLPDVVSRIARYSTQLSDKRPVRMTFLSQNDFLACAKELQHGGVKVAGHLPCLQQHVIDDNSWIGTSSLLFKEKRLQTIPKLKYSVSGEAQICKKWQAATALSGRLNPARIQLHTDSSIIYGKFRISPTFHFTKHFLTLVS